MARTVADVALFLSAIAGPDRESPLALQEDGARFRAPLERDFKGVARRVVEGARRHSRSSRRSDASSTRTAGLRELGCVVEEAEPDFAGVDEAFPILRYAVELSAVLASWRTSTRTG